MPLSRPGSNSPPLEPTRDFGPRAAWQRELQALTTETQINGEAWFNVKMHVLAKAMRFAVESSGFVSLAKHGL
jgi:hypothetical protein